MTKLPITLATSDLAVATRGLTKQYGDTTALRDVALQVPTGAVYLLVGPNGAGKSTAIRLLLDLACPTSGSVEVFGLNAARNAPTIHANVGYVPERPDWGYGWMRVGRLLEHHSRYFPSWDAQYAAHLTAKFELRTNQKLATLSKGQARRVHLTMALAHRPPLLVLDEPTDGLDPLMRDETLGVLADHLAESPTTVLLSTHHVEEVERLADHIGVLAAGELRAQASIDNVQRELRRYRVEVPADWKGVPSLNGSLLKRVNGGRESQLTVWGPEREVAQAIESSGARVRDAAPLSILEATLALLSTKG